jgi:prevent-host-death family protein
MMRSLAVSKFKARCLAVLDEVARTGEAVTLLRRGRPLARVLPAVAVESGYAQTRLVGSVAILGDVISPALPPGAWEAEGPPPRAKDPARRR